MNKRIKKKNFKSLGFFKKVKLNENDTIVIECNIPIKKEDCKHIHDYFKEFYPKNKILILPNWMKLKIMSE